MNQLGFIRTKNGWGNDFIVKMKVRGMAQIVGYIRQVPLPGGKPEDKGYQYFPKGQKVGGEIFSHYEDCKASLMVPA